MERQVGRAILTAVTCVAAALLCAPALADDYGPHPDIRAIRRDLPQINAEEGSVPGTEVGASAINSIVVYRDVALAEWHSPKSNRIEFMHRTYGKWWLASSIFIQSGAVFAGGGCDIYGPTSNLLKREGMEPHLIALAAVHLPSVRNADALAVHDTRAVRIIGCHSDIDVGDLVGGHHSHRSTLGFDRMDNDGYSGMLYFAADDGPEDASVEDENSRMPSFAESWDGGGNIYFVFSGTLKATRPVHVSPGSTVGVQFPFVLDARRRYRLVLSDPSGAFASVEGFRVYNNNHLTFTLPAFTMRPNDVITGEVVGDNE